MIILKRIALGSFLASLGIMLAILPAYAGGGDEAMKHSMEMISHGEEMVAHGGEGHMKIMIEHAEGMILHAKGTLKSIPEGDAHGKEAAMHINEAIKEAEAAVDHGGKGHGDIAMKHAKSALEHAKEGDSHVHSIK